MIQCTERGRFFINITEEGCPCGCLYCYVETIAGTEILLDESEIATLPKQLITHPDYVPGPYGTLLAFGAHCDLFRTSALVKGFLSALKAVAPLGNPIQISTKQFVRSDWAAQIAAISAFRTQVVIFVSCATIRQSALYEPRAAPPVDRFASFESLHAYNIPACLLIKPFIPGVTDSETSAFIEAVQSTRPYALCVGVFYLDERIAARLQLPHILKLKEGPKHPLMANSIWTIYPPPEFLTTLKIALPSIPIFQNSACVVACVQGIPCPIHVWERSPQLCVGCQDCQSLYQSAKTDQSSPVGTTY